MEVILTPEAKKHFAHLPANQQKKVSKKMLVLEHEPFSGKKLGGEFAQQHSLKVWPYRILYMIYEKRKEIYILSILHRQGAYK